MFGAAGSLLALSQADALHVVLPLVVLTAATAELYRPASAALIADLVPPGRRVPAYAAYRLAINAGFAAGPATAGFLAERSFFWLFVGDAATCALFGLVAILALPAKRRVGEVSSGPRFELIRALRADRAFLLFLLGATAAATVYFQQFSTLPLHVRDNGLDLSSFGLLISLNGLAILLLELPLTAFTSRRSPLPTIACGMLFTGVGFALTGPSHTTLALAGTVLLWTLGEMVVAPVASAYVADLAPPHLQGRYQGAFGTTFSIAFVVAPLAGSAVYAWRPSALWAGCAALGALGAALVLASGTKAAQSRHE